MLSSESDIESIITKKLQLLENNKNVSEQTAKELTSNLHQIAEDQRLQFLLDSFSFYPLFNKLVSTDSVLKAKLDLLRDPFNAKTSGNAEGNQIAKLLVLASKKMVYSLDELSEALFGSKSPQNTRDLQKVIMKAIQGNTVRAVIDQKERKVTFLFAN
jgi:hypothetical protein